MDSLMDKLEKLREKDIYYYVKARIDRLCARGASYGLLKLPNVVSVVILDTVETEYGSGTEVIKSRRERKRNIRKRQDIKVFPFDTCEDEKLGKQILAPIGGDRGIIRTGFYRTVVANKQARYWAPPIDLIRVFPEGDMKLGPAPPERPFERPIFVLEPRGRHETAEIVGYEAIINREVEFWTKINISCPLVEDDILTILHGSEDVPLGPTKRGHITILTYDKGNRKDYLEWYEQKGQYLIHTPEPISERQDILSAPTEPVQEK